MNKTGHSGRSCAAAHHKPFQNRLSPNYPDLRIVDLNLIDDGADIGAPEGRLAALDVRSHHLGEGRDLSSVILISGLISATAVEGDLRDVAFGLYRTKRKCELYWRTQRCLIL